MPTGDFDLDRPFCRQFQQHPVAMFVCTNCWRPFDQHKTGDAGSDSTSDSAPTFEKELESVINRFSQENGSNTPDFILAQFLLGCLWAWNSSVQRREQWYGRGHEFLTTGGSGVVPAAPTTGAQDQVKHESRSPDGDGHVVHPTGVARAEGTHPRESLHDTQASRLALPNDSTAGSEPADSLTPLPVDAGALDLDPERVTTFTPLFWLSLNDDQKYEEYIRVREALRAARVPQPPADYVALLKEAKAIVNASVLYRSFIDGTPLENDIAVWMADFAAKHQDQGVSETAASPFDAARQNQAPDAAW